MAAVSVLLIVLIGGINTANYLASSHQTARLLEMLTENDGVFPQTGPDVYKRQEYDYMLKVTTTNTHTLEMIMNRIKSFHGIKRTQTNVILSTTKQLHSVSPVL